MEIFFLCYLFENGDSIQHADNFIFVLFICYWLYNTTDVLYFLLKVLWDFLTIMALIYSLTDQWNKKLLLPHHCLFHSQNCKMG